MPVLSVDLDDTLYRELDFVESGFSEVAKYIASSTQLDKSLVLSELNRNLRKFGRGQVFDMTLKHFEVFSVSEVRRCLSVYRGHRPKISLAPQVKEVLDLVSQELPLYLVTDGNRLVQRRKVQALGIKPLFRGIYYTRDHGLVSEKPSLTCFESILRAEEISWGELMYVGDNPRKDFVSLRASGAITVGTQDGPYSGATLPSKFHPEIKIQTFVDLPVLLRQISWIN